MITILDALESVTNGMANPNLLEQIKEVPMGSPLRPYVELVLGLKAFYDQNPSRVAEHIAAIPEDSPASRLKPLLGYLSGVSPTAPEEKLLKQILHALNERKSVVAVSLEEALLYLDQGQEEAFTDSIAIVIRELYAKIPDTAKALSLWVFDGMDKRRWEGRIFSDHLRLIFGELESLRLRALFLLRSHFSEAFTSWTLYLIKLSDAPLKDVKEVEAALLIWLYLGKHSPHPIEARDRVCKVLEQKFPQLKSAYQAALTESPISFPRTVRRLSSAQLELFS